jgi:subtilisin
VQRLDERAAAGQTLASPEAEKHLITLQENDMVHAKSASLAFIAAFALGFFSNGVSLSAQSPDEYVVQFQNGTPAAARRAAVASAGASVRVVYNGVSAAAVRVPNDQALAALMRNPAVLTIVPNRPVFAYQTGTHGNGNKGGSAPLGQVVPPGVTRVGSPTSSSNGAGIGVAVLDTGIDLAHADLDVAPNRFTAFGTTCQDGHGHGTHVAGTVAARDNSIDVLGVAPAAKLYCVKVLDNTGSGSDETVMAGLDWVLSNHNTVSPAIKVINMSLGREGTVGDNPAMHALFVQLEAAGISVVVAAGNDPSSDVSEQIPAAYSEVMAVASTTAKAGSNQCRYLTAPIGSDTASYFTTDGQGVTVSAPGEDQEDVSRSCFITSIGILSTKRGGGTTRMSGTSMASPHVAGIAARYYQLNPQMLPSEVKAWIAAGAKRQTVAPLDSPSGAYTFDGVREGIAQAP